MFQLLSELAWAVRKHTDIHSVPVRHGSDRPLIYHHLQLRQYHQDYETGQYYIQPIFKFLFSYNFINSIREVSIKKAKICKKFLIKKKKLIWAIVMVEAILHTLHTYTQVPKPPWDDFLRHDRCKCPFKNFGYQWFGVECHISNCSTNNCISYHIYKDHPDYSLQNYVILFIFGPHHT